MNPPLVDHDEQSGRIVKGSLEITPKEKRTTENIKRKLEDYPSPQKEPPAVKKAQDKKDENSITTLRMSPSSPQIPNNHPPSAHENKKHLWERMNQEPITTLHRAATTSTPEQQQTLNQLRRDLRRDFESKSTVSNSSSPSPLNLPSQRSARSSATISTYNVAENLLADTKHRYDQTS